MTESERSNYEDPDDSLESYENWEQAGERKCRLYAVACARRIWDVYPDDYSRRVVEMLELLADNLCEESEFEAVCDEFLEESASEGLPQAQAMARSVSAGLTIDRGGRLASMAESYSFSAAWTSGTYTTSSSRRKRYQEMTLDLRRELLLHLFRPAEMPTLPLTPTVTNLAKAAYEERSLPIGHLDNDRLAVLSDALEEAGCTEEVLLAHLRSPGPHVRGCWALDLVLGKE